MGTSVDICTLFAFIFVNHQEHPFTSAHIVTNSTKSYIPNDILRINSTIISKLTTNYHTSSDCLFLFSHNSICKREGERIQIQGEISNDK